METKSEKRSATGRIHRLLVAGKGIKPDTASTDAWGELLGVNPKNHSELLHAIGGFFHQITLAKEEMEAHPNLDSNLFMGTVEEIETLLSQGFVGGLRNQWGNVMSGLDKAQMRSMAFCAERLDELVGESPIPADVLDGLGAEVERVLQATLDSNLPADIKQNLSSRLLDLKRAIVEYRIAGVKPIRAATEATIGAVAVVTEAMEADNKSDLLEQILALTAIAIAVVNVNYGGPPELAAATQVFLTTVKAVYLPAGRRLLGKGQAVPPEENGRRAPAQLAS